MVNERIGMDAAESRAWALRQVYIGTDERRSPVCERRNSEMVDLRKPFTEPNTGRTLYIRHAGGDRFAVFDKDGRFCMELTHEFLQEIGTTAEQVRSVLALGDAAEVAAVRAQLPPQCPVDLESSSYPNALLSHYEVNALEGDVLEAACRLAGLPWGSKGYTHGAARADLQRHHQRTRKLLSDGAVSAMESELRKLRKTNGEQAVELMGARGRGEELMELQDVLQRLRAEAVERTNAIIQVRQNLQLAHDRHAELQNSWELDRNGLAEAGDQLVSLARRERDSARGELEQVKASRELLLEKLSSSGQELVRLREQVGTMDQEAKAKTETEIAKTSTAGALIMQAAQLAAMQRASEVFANRVTKLAVDSGFDKSLMDDARVQGLIGAVVPLLLMQFGDQIPGLKNVAALQPLAQQKLVMDMASIMNVTMRDLFGVMVDVVGALNDGDPVVVEQVES